MADITTDLSIYKPWNVAAGFNNTFTFTFTLSNVAFNITGYTFSLQIRKFGESTNIVNLTQGSGLTNGGVSGVVTVVLSAAQSALLTHSEYFWQLTVVHPTAFSYRWFNGVIRAWKELYTGDTFSNVSSVISLNGTNINAEVSLPGEVNHDRGEFDASLGFPSSNGSGAGGARKQFDRFINTGVGAVIADVFVSPGAIVMVLADDPTNDWEMTGHRLI